MDIVAFLEARLAEDGKLARRLCKGGKPAVGIAGQWDAYIEGGDDGWAFEDNSANGSGAIVGSRNVARHIANHDPRRVLREVQAKRAVLALYAGTVTAKEASATAPGESAARMHLDAERELAALEPVIRHHAAVWSDHPDYRPEWKP